MRLSALVVLGAIAFFGGGTLISLRSGGDGVPQAKPVLAMTTTPSLTPTLTPTFKPTHTPKATTTPFAGKNTPPPGPTSCPSCPFVTPTHPGPTSTFVATATPGHMWYIDPVVLSRIAIPGPVTTTTTGDWCQGAVPYSFGVASTAGFPAGGSFYLRKEGYGTTFFTYNSKTATTFNITSCSGSHLIYKPGTPVRGGDLYLLCLTRRDPFGSVNPLNPIEIDATSVCYHTYEPQSPPAEPSALDPAGLLPSPNGNGAPFLSPSALIHMTMAGSISAGSMSFRLEYPPPVGDCFNLTPNILAGFQLGQGVAKTSGRTFLGKGALRTFDAPPATSCTGAGLGTFVGPYITTGLTAEHDQDRDGCTDREELGGDFATSSGEMTGGLRDPWSFWDFYDVYDGSGIRNGSVTASDIFAVLARFGSSGDTTGDPLAGPIPPAPIYHAVFDRGAVIGPGLWNLRPPDGAIAVTDVFSSIAQFGHSCA